MEALVKRLADGIVSRGGVKPSEFFGTDVPSPPTVSIQQGAAQRIVVPVGSGVIIPAFLLRAPEEKGLLMAVDDRGKEALVAEPLVRLALARGWTVCGVDPRGIGELATQSQGWLFAAGLLAGENFVWRQATDLLAVTTAMRAAAPFTGKPVALYGRGDNAAMAATYALGQEPFFAWYVLRNGFVSYRQFLERPSSLAASFRLLDQDRRVDRFTAYGREIPFSYLPFDVLRHFDLPQLLASSQAAGFVLEPIDGDWKVMKPRDAQRLLPERVQVLEDASALEPRL